MDLRLVPMLVPYPPVNGGEATNTCHFLTLACWFTVTIAVQTLLSRAIHLWIEAFLAIIVHNHRCDAKANQPGMPGS